jgi:hypothetical protein
VRDSIQAAAPKGRLPAALIAVALTVLGVTAIAGAALETKRAEKRLDPGEKGSASAKCSKGTRAVSGGFDAPGFTADPPDGSYVEAFATLRSTKRKWSSTAGNFFNAADPGTLLDFAYCSHKLPRLRARSSSSTTVPNGGLESLTVRCPRGGEAVWGGFKAPGSGFNQVAVFESRRLGKRRWRVTGQGTSLSESRLKAFAYCAKHKLGLTEKVATTRSAQDTVILARKARCKKGEVAVSGGFASTLDEDVYVQVFRSRRAGKRGWKAAAGSYPSSGTLTEWDVYAYCL